MDDTIQNKAIAILLDAARSGAGETILMNSQVALKDLFGEDKDSCQRFTDVLGAMRGIHLTHAQVRDAERQTDGAANEQYRKDVFDKMRNILVTTFDLFASGLAGQADLAQTVGGLGKRLQAHALLEGEVDRAIEGCVAQIDANQKTLDAAQEHRAKVDNFLAAHKALISQ
jgi:hypothetical protein